MTKVYDNTNSGALFKNNEKKTEKHPDYQGSINVLGMDFWISAWLKTSQSGNTKYMSLAVTKKQPKGESRPVAQTQNAELDDEIPF